MKTLAALMALGIVSPVAIAQAAGAPDGEVFTWMTGSVVTVLAGAVIAFLRGWVVGGKTHDRVVQERDNAYAELGARNKEDRELLIPALIRNTEIMARFMDAQADGRK